MGAVGSKVRCPAIGRGASDYVAEDLSESPVLVETGWGAAEAPLNRRAITSTRSASSIARAVEVTRRTSLEVHLNHTPDHVAAISGSERC